ncbi:HAD family hydrolase [Mucilaginibacter robiniae]|uniref:HAD family hydrolase n=1 Tax=Mucilaginibacter robiniae TaxID=2728022 RepID=A0A7L5E157_9SPHI|nr:HAD family hydrolase [Mucilaginibacter robiniae]QJD96238.1 HAD family hydrolase [Mucilaginibacter robiniae]
MNNQITTIAFDADDTLWQNEIHFQDTERKFCALLEDYLPQHTITQELFQTEMQNLSSYGYGVKGFMLSMIETALRITSHNLPAGLINRIITLGKELLAKPVELLPGVKETLESLYPTHRLVIATKGDLLDQERKLEKSGLQQYFHHISIMSDKQPKDYHKLLQSLDCSPENFLMVGNSIKSDIIPVLKAGAFAAHIPFHPTWVHEQVESPLKHPRFIPLTHINEITKRFSH